MINIALTVFFPQGIFAAAALSLVDNLSTGALNSLLVGAIVGAVVWSVSQAPDTVGRVFLFGLFAALIMLFVQVAITLNVIGEVSLPSLIDAFQNRQAVMAARLIEGGQWIGIAGLVGALLGVIFTLPGEAIKGAIIGLVAGAFIGAALNVAIIAIGLRLNVLIFQFLVGLLVWGLLASLGGK